jgi:arginase
MIGRVASIELIGVPFDGYGRPGNQARASAVLRAAGLADAFAGQDVHDSGDVGIPAPDPTRPVAPRRAWSTRPRSSR